MFAFYWKTVIIQNYIRRQILHTLIYAHKHSHELFKNGFQIIDLEVNSQCKSQDG